MIGEPSLIGATGLCAVALLAACAGVALLRAVLRRSRLLAAITVSLAAIATSQVIPLVALPIYWLLGGTWVPGK